MNFSHFSYFCPFTTKKFLFLPPPFILNEGQFIHHCYICNIYNCRLACAITDDGSTSVVITGGSPAGYRGLDEVTRYSLDGGATALPSLQTARGGHACGHFIDNKNNQVTIVILFVVSQQICSCHLCYRSYWLLEELMVTTSCPLQRS